MFSVRLFACAMFVCGALDVFVCSLILFPHSSAHSVLLVFQEMVSLTYGHAGKVSNYDLRQGWSDSAQQRHSVPTEYCHHVDHDSRVMKSCANIGHIMDNVCVAYTWC